MDDLKIPKYWTQRIHEVGIDEVEEIISNDRSLPGADINAARQKAIDSYRRQERLAKFKTPPYQLGFAVPLIILVALIYTLAT